MKWLVEYEIGVSELDGQHRELFENFDRLMECIDQGQGKEVVGEFLGFIDSYIECHFSIEEKLMEDAEYPGKTVHVSQHRLFSTGFRTLQEALAKSGDTRHLEFRIAKDWSCPDSVDGFLRPSGHLVG